MPREGGGVLRPRMPLVSDPAVVAIMGISVAGCVSCWARRRSRQYPPPAADTPEQGVAEAEPELAPEPSSGAEPAPDAAAGAAGGASTEAAGLPGTVGERQAEPARVCCACAAVLPKGQGKRCSACKQVWFCGRECQKRAWPQHKDACRLAQGELQLEAGIASFQQGDIRAALRALETAAKTFAKAEHGRRHCEASLLVGECHKLLQNVVGADAAFETALATAADGIQKSEALSAKATLASARRDWGRAQELLQEALSLAQDASAEGEAGRKALRAEGVAHSNLGKCLSGQGKLEEAVGSFESALRCRRSSGAEPSELATCCTNLASALIMGSGDGPTLGGVAAPTAAEEGKPGEASSRERALSLYGEALELAEANGLKKLLQPLLTNLSNYLEDDDQPDSRAQAAKYRARLVRLMSDLGRTDLPSDCVICLEPLKVEERTEGQGRVAVLECLHFFHKECLERGMEQQQQGGGCPACRRAIF